MLASLLFNARGGNNVILFLTRRHQIEGLHIQRRGALFCSLRCFLRCNTFSLIRIDGNYETPSDTRSIILHVSLFFLGDFFGGSLASLGIHEYLPLKIPTCGLYN